MVLLFEWRCACGSYWLDATSGTIIAGVVFFAVRIRPMHEFILISNGFQPVSCSSNCRCPKQDSPKTKTRFPFQATRVTAHWIEWHECVCDTHTYTYTFIYIYTYPRAVFKNIHQNPLDLWDFFGSLTFLSKSPVWWPKRHQCHQCHAMATAPYQAGCSLEGRDPWLGYVVNNYGKNCWWKKSCTTWDA